MKEHEFVLFCFAATLLYEKRGVIVSINSFLEEKRYMPVSLAASLAADSAARDAFAKMTAQQQDAIICRARAARSREELFHLVSGMYR
jgi:uncharacterized protein YdeI (YjbR/CyaY-like superfamily)